VAAPTLTLQCLLVNTRPSSNPYLKNYLRSLKQFLVVVLLCACLHNAHAQTANLTGSIHDQTGAEISAAKLSLRSLDSNVELASTSNDAGEYSYSAIPPGKYSLHVEKQGFESVQRNGIVLSVDTMRRLDIVLSIGEQAQTVEVNSSLTLLQPNNPEMATEVTSREYDALPLIQSNRVRNPSSFVYLAPGVQGNIRLDGNEYTGATNVISVNGSSIWTTELILEGLPAGGTRYNGNLTESSPTVDAVSEFKITTTLLPADYGHTGYAVGSFAIKSGTNRLHASIYEYFRNTALNAANWYAKNQGSALTNPPDHQNEFGATIGGPLRIPHLYDGTDRTFFFFAYGGSRFTGATAYTTSTVPTAQELTVNSAGYYDFSDLKTPIYNPATTAVNPSGAGFVRTKFSGNLIPASQVDPVAKRVLSYYPLPAPGKTTIGGFTGDLLLNPNSYTAKVDHVFNPHQRLSSTFITTSIPRINTSSALPIPLASGYHQNVQTITFRVNDQWTITNSLVNAAAVGYSRYVNPQTPTGTASNYPSLLGLNGLTGGLFPTFAPSGYTTFGDITDADKTENDYLYRDTLYKTHGSHNFRGGGEYRAVEYNDYSPNATTGSFTFKTNETGNPQSTSGTGNAFASFLLGQVDSATATVPFPLLTRKNYTGFFIQDDWKALHNLTINLGLRFEWQGAPTEAHDHQSIVNLTAPNPGAGGLPGAVVFAGPGSSHLFPTDYSAIGPRFGLAYQMFPNTVIRAGYGVYYSEILPDIDIVNSGFSAVGSFSNTSGSVSPVFTLASGVPGYTTSQKISPTILNGTTGSYYGPNMGAMPRTQNYSLNIQQQITKNSALELAYIGVHNTRQVAPNMVNINQVNPDYLSLGSALLTSTATAANLAKAGISAPYAGFSGTIAQALRPFPQYSTLTSVAAKAGASEYNGGQVVYRIQASHGLTLNSNYTYSKLMGYANQNLEGNTGTANTVQNAYNPAADRAILPNDVRHALVIDTTYALPFGRGKALSSRSGIVDDLVGGWSLSAIQRYQSGFPLSLLMSTNALAIFNSYQRPNIVPGIDPSSHISNGKFNPASGSNLFNMAAFASPGNSSFGNAAPTYSDLRNFPVLSEDLSALKTTKLGEHVDWAFYAQAFNVFNRHRFTGFGTAYGAANFGQPNATNAARAIQFGTRFQY
jgi:Carboxypeptidase regulatory-like domain/TonB dependent receptor